MGATWVRRGVANGSAAVSDLRVGVVPTRHRHTHVPRGDENQTGRDQGNLRFVRRHVSTTSRAGHFLGRFKTRVHHFARIGRLGTGAAASRHVALEQSLGSDESSRLCLVVAVCDVFLPRSLGIFGGKT